MLLLWVVMGVLGAAASIAALSPLFRQVAVERGQGDAGAAEIYRDQLREIDRDTARGLVAAEEAEAARVEIARRLLAAEEAREAAPSEASAWRKTAIVAIVAAPIAAVGVYLLVGSPLLEDQPLAARLDASPQEADVAVLLERVEQHLAENPDDGRGWEVVAPIYARLGRFEDAAAAFSSAIRTLGSTPAREANYGEALVWANNGLIISEAREAFQRAVTADAEHTRSRFYLARALEQEERYEEAGEAWKALLEGAAGDEPWVRPARAALAEIDQKLGREPTQVATAPPVEAPRGPTVEDMEAAQELAPEDRQAMIEGMVASLAARLEETPDDPEGWVRLIRSYVVLNQGEAAQSALSKARLALSDDRSALDLIESAARDLGLEAQGTTQ